MKSRIKKPFWRLTHAGQYGLLLPGGASFLCRVRPGDTLRAGERYGLIRFGSRTDLVVPRGTELRVRVRDRVRGGESVMGVLR